MFGIHYHGKCTPQDISLHVLVEGLAKVVAHGVIDENCSWWLHLGNQITTCCDTYCGDPRFFHLSTDQTHGLVVKGSGRACDQDIDLVFDQLPDKSRRGFLQQFGAVVDPSHESAPQPFCDPTDLT